MALITPVVRSIGTWADGTGTSTPNLGTGTVTGDLLVAFVTTGGGTPAMASSTPPWYTVATQVHDNINTGIGIFYRIAEADGNTGPRTCADSGLWTGIQIITIQKDTFDATTPFEGPSATTADATTAVSIGSDTSTKDQSLVWYAASGHLPDATATNAEFSSEANASLSNVTERIDQTTRTSDGGAMGVWSGEKVSAGATGTFTATAATSADRAYVSAILRPYDSGGGGGAKSFHKTLLGVGT